MVKLSKKRGNWEVRREERCTKSCCLAVLGDYWYGDRTLVKAVSSNAMDRVIVSVSVLGPYWLTV